MGREYAHRFSWKHFHGPTGKMSVLHKCDVPSCVKPPHLFLGNQKDNVLDAWRKGRHKIPDNSGERQGRAKLTRVTVAYIRTNRNISAVLLAAKFKVTSNHIRAIRQGLYWK